MNLLGAAGAIFLIILNIVVILLGLGLIIIGSLVYKESGLVNDDISPVLNAITGGDFTLSDLIRIIAIVIIVIGVFSFWSLAPELSGPAESSDQFLLSIW